MRWDNTFRYNLGARVQDQNPAILGAVNNDDGDRNFLQRARWSPAASTSCPSSTSSGQKQFGARFSRGAGWWDPAYNNLDNNNTLTANTLGVNGLPAPGVLSP